MLIDEDLPVAVPVGHPGWHARASAIAREGRLDVVEVETVDRLTVATHRKVGWRYGSHGDAVAQDLHLEDTARQAVSHAMAVSPRSSRQRDDREHLDETRRLWSLVHDPGVWNTRPLRVDGTLFVLFIAAVHGAEAAVADLGPIRLALYGPVVSRDLALRLVPLATLDLERPPLDLQE